jgi:deazaflavin-dependent oxidoreductase (nitroreductase family)
VFARFMRRLGATRFFARVAPKVAPPLDRFVHRISGGRWHVADSFLPTLMLTSTGRRSGQARQQPLAYVAHDGGWVVVGTNFGQDHHPAWTHNLLATPTATVEVAGRTADVEARLLDGPDRDRAWRAFVEMWPAYELYLERSHREPRMFHLVPLGDALD